MKKFRLIAIISLLAFAVFTITACEPTSEKTKISLTMPGQMVVGETRTVTVTFTPAELAGELIWSSSDPSVATVNNGVVQALKVGTTIINAKLASDLTVTASKTLSVIDGEIGENPSYLVDGDTWVFFTGVRYRFDSVDIKLVDPSSECLDLVTIDGATNIYAMEVGETTISNIAGTITRKVKVVYQVIGFGNGTDITGYNDQTIQKQYIDQTARAIKVGASNDFIFDLSVTALAFDENRIVRTVSPSVADLTLEYAFQDDTANVYTFDQVAEATTKGIDFKDSTIGSKLLVTCMPKYQLDDDDFSAEYWIEINDGYNVYDNNSMKEIFADLGVQKINVQRNIVAELDESQYYLGEGGVLVPYNSHIPSEEFNGKRGTVYLRYGATSVGHLVVEGNFFTIQGKDLPLFVGNDKEPGQGGFVDSQGARKVVAAQSAIFRTAVDVVKSSYDPNDSSITINDLTVIGNTNRPAVDDLTLSGGYLLYRHDNVDGYLNNSILKYGTQGDQIIGSFVSSTINQSIISDMWASCVFLNTVGRATIVKSTLKNSGAALITLIDTEGNHDVNPEVNVDLESTLENICSASSPWFQAYGLTTIQTMLAEIEKTIGTFNAIAKQLQVPFNKTVYADRGSGDQTSKFNFTILYQNENPLPGYGGNPEVRAKVTIGGVEVCRPYDYKSSNVAIGTITSAFGGVYFPFGSDFATVIQNKFMELIIQGLSQQTALETAFAMSFIETAIANQIPFIEIMPDLFNCVTVIPLYDIV